jgi:hypothetical protein
MKRGFNLLVIVFVLLFLTPFLLAEENNTAVDNARTCLKDKIGEDCSSLTSEQRIFSLLALGDYQDCKAEFLDSSNNLSSSQECWPASACEPKQTSLALITLFELGEDTSKASNWLLNQTKTASDLIWFLQIESPESTSCSVTYNENSYDFEISENKKISSNAGSCLTRAYDDYWFQISSDSSCLNHNYDISCDKVFKTTLLYKSPDSPTIHVSQVVHDGDAGDLITEKISYKCFKRGGVCDFESSLWATLTLNFLGYDITNYLPYLEATYQSNTQLFPETFLYRVTSSQEYLETILSTRFNGKFWTAGSGNKFYDTALAFLALRDGYSEVDLAKQYLLDTSNQNEDGCWGTLSDTGFLLYTGWPTHTTPSPINGDGQNGGTDSSDCESYGNYCVGGRRECINAGGEVLSNFDCLGLDVCCSQPYEDPELKTCSEQGGEFCTDTQYCETDHRIYGYSDDISNNDCCNIGHCKENIDDEKTECEDEGYSCRNNCFEDEEQTNFQCDSGEVCCKPLPVPPASKFPWIIVILVILIILIIIAIIFRNKLKMFFFRFKSKFKSSNVPRKSPPRFPPRAPPPTFRPPMPPINRPRPPQPPRAPPKSNSPNDKEFEDTLKKLRDMSN